jgi:hypothetical protein
MVRMFARHRVSDYAAWREVYDSIDADRRDAGVTDDAVFRSVGDPNDVTIWHDFDNAEAAEAFGSSSLLRDAMGRAGVEGRPEIWLTTQS